MIKQTAIGADQRLAVRIAFDIAPGTRLLDLAYLTGLAISTIHGIIKPLAGVMCRGERAGIIRTLWETETRGSSTEFAGAMRRAYAHLAERLRLQREHSELVRGLLEAGA